MLLKSKYCRIRAVADWNDDAPYLGAENSETNLNRAGFIATPAAEDVVANKNTIFYFDGTNLLSYGSGNYLVSNDDKQLFYNGVQESGSKISFTVASNGVKGAYNIKFNDGKRTLYVNQNNYTDAANNANEENGYCFNLEVVKSLPVTISSAGYASFYAPVALKIPTDVDVEAYYIGAVNAKDGYVTMNKIEGVIPANTGVILKGAEGTYNFGVVSNTTAINGENLLTGTVAATEVEDDAYVLGIGEDGVGLYRTKKYEETLEEYEEAKKENEDAKKPYFINGSHKAYLPSSAIPAGASLSAGFTFDFSGTTGIDEVKSEVDNTAIEGIFDLMGRRVENPTRGIYIVNGKRVFIK